jgi:hypothetical protein
MSLSLNREGFMNLTVRAIAFSCLICASSFGCYAKEWRGIVPLHSTRADVIRLLGNPRHVQGGEGEFFEVENGVVAFEWVDPTCVRKYPVEPPKAIRPDDLVLDISVRLAKPMSEDALGIPQGKLWLMDCLCGKPQQSCSCIFMDTDGEGFGYTTSDAGVTSLSYSATAKDFQAWKVKHTGCVSTRN